MFIYSYKNPLPVLFLILLFLPFLAASTPTDLMEKEKLHELIEQRKIRFSAYFNSIEKKSGIFGNKTKKDLTLSNSILTDIVKTDNQIIQVLNRALDYKSFEKTGFNYEKLEQDQQIQNLTLNNQVLIKKQELLIEENNKNKSAEKYWKNISVFLIIILVMLLIYIFRNNYHKMKPGYNNSRT
jgi:hypothetical protein